MKTPFIVIASIVGVLATAGAAMAVNAGTLAGADSGNIGNAPSVLVDSPSPVPSGTATTSPTPTPTPSVSGEPGDDDGVGHDVGDDNGGDTSGSDDGAGHDVGDDHGGDSDDDSGDDSHESGDDD